MLEAVKQLENMAPSGIGGSLTSYVFENVDLKRVLPLSVRVGSENLERNVSLRPEKGCLTQKEYVLPRNSGTAYSRSKASQTVE